MKAEILKRLDNCNNDQLMVRATLDEYIRSLGIEPSGYYAQVLEYLYSNHTHPTAENIYVALSKTDHTLSRSKIHTILDILSRAGAIRTIHLGKHDTHYDADTSKHAHFICEHCGVIINMEMMQDCTQVLPIPQGASLYDVHVLCIGECANCREEGIN